MVADEAAGAVALAAELLEVAAFQAVDIQAVAELHGVVDSTVVDSTAVDIPVGLDRAKAILPGAG